LAKPQASGYAGLGSASEQKMLELCAVGNGQVELPVASHLAATLRQHGQPRPLGEEAA
jgi:hypothetical protein